MSSQPQVAPAKSEATPETPRPTWRMLAPFAVVAVVGVLSAMLPRYREGGPAFWSATVLLLAAAAAQTASMLRPRRTWLDPMGSYLLLPAIGVARDATGGGASGLAPMVALPLIWLAITGTRRHLYVAGALVIAVFVVPVLLIGPPEYPTADWRRALVLAGMAVLVAPVLQGIVAQLGRETERARTANAEMDGIMRGARQTSLVAVTLDGTVRSFSVGAEELLGYHARDVVGLAKAAELFHDPDEVAEVADELGVEPEEVFAHLARTGSPARIWTYLRADGRRILVRLVMTELTDDDGRPTGYLGVAIDTTAEVEAERARARSEAQWRVLADHLPETTLLLVDEERRIRLIGGGGALRQSLRGMEERPLSEVISPENALIVEALVGQAFAGREASWELRAATTGAEYEVVVSPFPGDVDGMRALVLARDVSVERQQQKELMRANERSERLFEDAPHGIALLDTEGRMVRDNAALRTLLGAAPGALVGRRLAELGPPKDTSIEQHLVRLMHGRDPVFSSDCTLVDVLGQETRVVLTSRVLRHDGAEDAVLVNVVDVSERRRYEERLAHLADHDVLTGLANRRRFDAELQRHVDRCGRTGPTGALLLLDLDHFKRVNDSLGHSVGDELLITTAGLLRRAAGSGDLVARLGGDEFTVLLTECDQPGAEAVARSIVELIRDHAATLDGARRRVTASVGVVTFRAAAEHSGDILALADMTMYDAKEAGRDRYACLAEGQGRQPRLGARMDWQSRMEDALVNGGFELQFQPIMDLRTDRINAAEVLLRLRDSGALVPPSRFLYIAERVGLMPELDAFVVRRSVAYLERLNKISPDFTLEVNLSGHSMGHPAIEEAIVDSLRTHDVDPGRLVLEITETAAVADVTLARAFAERLTERGCKFALDDFGAGFGSFYYLKHLLFDYVKIDGEFVANSHLSSVDRTIMRSIVGIARDLGKETVAEFVSEPEILEVVRAEGVDHAQGYLIGKPTAYADFVSRYLRRADTWPPAPPEGAEQAATAAAPWTAGGGRHRTV